MINDAHLHLILTHFPVIGVIGAIGILAFGVWRRQEVLQRTGLVILVLTGVSAGAAYLTGEGAEEALEGQAGVSEALVERHEEAAEVGLIGAGLVGALALGTLVVSRKGPVRRGMAGVALAGAFLVAGALGWTANLGGQIRHPEIRSALTGSNGDEAPRGGDESD